MGSYAEITIADYPISSSKNYFYQWFFKKSDRVIRTRPKSKCNSLIWGQAEPHDLNEEETDYLYLISAKVLKRRLELAGYNRETLEREFEESIAARIQHLESLSNYDWATNEIDSALPIFLSTSLDEWLACLKVVIDNRLTPWRFDKQKQDFDDPRIGLLVTADYWGDEGIGHETGFPCQTLENLAVAFLEVVPEDAECALDITALISGGWTEAFEDMIEYNKDFTTFYEVFYTAIADTRSLMELSPHNPTLARLLYANVITAMETYLSDTLKKQVINRQAITRRFVQTSDAFKERIPVSDIFKRLDNLKEEIVKTIDMMSFHNLDKTTGIYKSVLDTHFPIELLFELKQAVDNRHDIVHRNGKTTQGNSIDVSMDDVENLITLVDKTIRHLDNQIKEGLLDDIDE